VRGVAMLTAKRTKDLPDVPTAAEAGYPIESQSWQGISVRAGTPADIVRKLNTDIVRVLNMNDVRNGIEGMGNTVTPGTPEEFEKFISLETAKWRKVITSAGIRID
jgi:tripartite-type tricarboxylate transporter receptor subunit TctC